MTTGRPAAPEPVVSIPTGPGEEPWTAEELAEVRAELADEVKRLQKKVAVAEEELHALLTEGTDVAGRDPADVGSSNFERDQGMSLTAHARELLDQSVQALKLFDDGRYGVCEVCGNPIGKGRLQAFPRATMCVACKQRSERR
ncbi:MAG: TraR/DksA family transcriptional regulator [Propionibacteriaceae bacterium]|nr:TraR/DksA family transcriptional regulator [Propionibacteriaceae bacterium]